MSNPNGIGYFAPGYPARRASAPARSPRFKALIIGAFATIRFWIERRRQRQALGEIAELDDHLLADIGLSQDAARREASKPFWA